MRDQHACRAVVNAATQQLHYGFRRGGVQSAGGFVREYELPHPHQRPGNGDALALTTGNFRRIAVRQISLVNVLQRSAPLRAGFFGRHFPQFQREGHIFQDGESGN